MAKRGDPKVLRLVVLFLRSHSGLTQEEFGKAARVAQSDVSRYESGTVAVPEVVLRRMAAAARVDWPIVVHLRRAYATILNAAARRTRIGMAGPLDLAVLEPALLAVTPYLLEDGTLNPEPEAARREAEEVWAALERFPLAYRRRLIELSSRSGRGVALVARVCEASVRAAAHRTEDAQELAELALFIAERIPGPESRRSRAEGYCWAHLGNAHRIATDFDAADEAFARAWKLWGDGDGTEPKLLPGCRLLDLEASLRREQNRFPDALALLDQARAACGSNPVAVARILLKKQNVLEQMGAIEGALAALEQATPWVEASGDPHLLFALRFNQAVDLCHLERWKEAAKLLPWVMEKVAERGNELESIRGGWLQAKVAAGLGRDAEATARLEQVSRDFRAHDLPYEAALSSLDLALLWLKAGRTQEVKGLAVAMGWIFTAKGIDREALQSLALFCEAARLEAATVELARRAIAEIETARRSAPPCGGKGRE
jgi:transcriptional regulator with XRE-family HTH domain